MTLILPYSDLKLVKDTEKVDKVCSLYLTTTYIKSTVENIYKKAYKIVSGTIWERKWIKYSEYLMQYFRYRYGKSGI